jgi:BASS family bile acid:Na+ symporter
MILIPVLFYFSIRIFNPDLAIGILLLTAMPSGVSTPALTDIVKGNIPVSMSLTIVSQMISPFTVPLLFWLISIHGYSLDKLLMLKDMANIFSIHVRSTIRKPRFYEALCLFIWYKLHLSHIYQLFY